MKKYLLVLTLLLTGCSLHEILEIQKDPSVLFETKEQITPGEVEGVLTGRGKLGSVFICYYTVEDGQNINGFSVVRDDCPNTLTHVR